MFPPFPQESARHYCNKLISLIEKGDVLLKQCGRESEERKGQGLMVGSLVCWEKSDNGGRRVVLYAVSGNNKQLEINSSDKNSFVEKSIFVPSLVSSEKIDEALAENDFEIHKLTDEINKLTLVNKTSPQRKKLIEKRTSLTDASLKNVFNLTLSPNTNSKILSELLIYLSAFSTTSGLHSG